MFFDLKSNFTLYTLISRKKKFLTEGKTYIFKNYEFIFQHAPGIPKVLVGNRLHLAFKRQVDQDEAESYANKNSMGFFEVSPLVNFNISETFVELARMALKRNGMERLWRSNKGRWK